MGPKIISVKPLEGYRIEVKFDDGVNGIYDLNHLAGQGVFKVWDDYNYFNKVFINPESNAIAWDEELEIDTLNCYLHVRGISFEEFKELNKKEQHAFR